MVELRELSHYCPIYGDSHPDKVEMLHGSVGEYRERFEVDVALQNVLLNGRSRPGDEQRLKSYLDVKDPTINRTRTLVHLYFLNYLIEAATTPQVAVIEPHSRIIVPGEDEPETRIRTAQGLDFLAVDDFASEWLSNPISQVVREFQETLQKAFDEYNMKFILFYMGRSQRSFIPPEMKKEAAIQENIQRVFDRSAYPALDSAYYNIGNRFFHSCGELCRRLGADEFGKKFLLNMDEEVGLTRELFP